MFIAAFNQPFYRFNIVKSKQIGLGIGPKVGAKTISVIRYADLITVINNRGRMRCTQRAVNEMKGTLGTFKIKIINAKKKAVILICVGSFLLDVFWNDFNISAFSVVNHNCVCPTKTRNTYPRLNRKIAYFIHNRCSVSLKNENHIKGILNVLDRR